MAGTRKNFDRSDLIAVAALLMSMMALFVSIYEARILKAQHKIMVSQERTSVWPYVDGNLTYQYADKVLIDYVLENKGIGPSRIGQMDLWVNGQPISDYATLRELVNAYFPDSILVDLSLVDMENQILSPSEQVQTLSLQFERFKGDVELVRNFSVNYEVCYCSIYDECWFFDGRNNGKNQPCKSD